MMNIETMRKLNNRRLLVELGEKDWVLELIDKAKSPADALSFYFGDSSLFDNTEITRQDVLDSIIYVADGTLPPLMYVLIDADGVETTDASQRCGVCPLQGEFRVYNDLENTTEVRYTNLKTKKGVLREIATKA